jgi:hypothetical protein
MGARLADCGRGVKIARGTFRGALPILRKLGVAAAAAVVAMASEPARISTKGFEQLEEQIDDSLTTARGLDREALHTVIGLLRRARN